MTIADASLTIDVWVEGHRDELLEFLVQLVRTRSDVEPPLADESACQRLIAGAYRDAGLDVDVFTLGEVPALASHPLMFPTWDGMPRPLSDRVDVVGALRGSGGGRSLLISAHVDTVSAGNPKEWTSGDPFDGRIAASRLYGRGSWDTKWGLAAGLFAARCVAELELPHRGDLMIESVADEEFGGSHGVLAARLRGHHANAAFNCEPTGMIVGNAHRGGGEWRIFLHGEDRGLAFGEKRGSSAVDKLAAAIEAIGRWNEERNQDREPLAAFAEDPHLPAYIMQVTGGGASYADVTGVPEECSLVVWAEEDPGVTDLMHHQSLQGGMDRILAQNPAFSDGVMPEYRPTVRYLPGSNTACPPEFLDAVKASHQSIGVPFRMSGVPLACDTYVFNLYSGIPAFTIGPRGGNAHATDEYVSVDDVVDLVRIFVKTAARWCA